jgi:hypothetical protein
MMDRYQWSDGFQQLYEKGLAHYQAGARKPEAYFSTKETKWLRGIGCSAQEIYDFVEDWCDDGEPSFGTALLVTAVRRDYFLQVQQGKPSGRVLDLATLPDRKKKLGGLPWLPRIIVKARAKLRGELPVDLMYSCGGDRKFLKKIDMHPADFLRIVWAAGDRDEYVLERIRERG